MSFLSFVDSLNQGIQSVAPVVQTISQLSNQFLNQTSNTQAGGNYGGPSGPAPSAAGEWYKNPLVWVGVAFGVLLLFGKKLKRLF